MENRNIWLIIGAIVLVVIVVLVYNSTSLSGNAVGIIADTENCEERGDSGNDPYVYGEIIYQRGLRMRTSKDICEDNQLREFYCTADGQAAFKIHNCVCTDWKKTCEPAN